MGVSGFGNSKPVHICRAGTLTGCQTKKCRIGVSFSKTLKVTCFYDQRQRCVCSDPQETSQLLWFAGFVSYSYSTVAGGLGV